jgi:MarR family transcriptional regulator, lower aerobic nicotinate degradation pathway regulator
MSSAAEGLAASTGYLLALVGADSRRRWVQALSSAGLRPADFGVLMTLGASRRSSQAELAETLGIDPRNLVAVIDRLEERGLIDRAPDPVDRRRHAVRLTGAGRRSLTVLRRAGTAAERELLADLNAAERRQLKRLLVKLAGF